MSTNVMSPGSRSKEALHFWVGLVVIGTGLYLGANHFLSGFMASDEGLQSGSPLADILIDTVFMIGWVSVSAFAFMKNVLVNLYERLTASSSEVTVENPILDILRDIDHRLTALEPTPESAEEELERLRLEIEELRGEDSDE